MKDEKIYNVYIHNGKSYLEAKFSNYDSFKANGVTIGIESHRNHPDYIQFDCKVNSIVGYFKQKEQDIEYRIKDKFKDLPNVKSVLKIDSQNIDDELYYIHKELIDQTPEDLNLDILDWDCEPTIPRYVNVRKPFKWSIEDKREYSRYPCYISPMSAFNILCERAKVLIHNNTDVFSNCREFKDNGRFKWLSCQKKKSNNSTIKIKLEEYYLAKPEHLIEGKNLKDCLNNLESYISYGLKKLTCHVPGDCIDNVNLEYGEQYKMLDNGYVLIKIDGLMLDSLKRICSLSNHIVFEKFFSKSRLGKSLISILKTLDKKFKSKPTFVINK